MLFTTVTGFGVTDELVDLKSSVLECITQAKTGLFSTGDSAAAARAATCALDTQAALQKIQGTNFVDSQDQKLIFDITSAILTNWIDMDVGRTEAFSEAAIRALAINKLLDATVDAVKTLTTIQLLSNLVLTERDGVVQVRMIEGLTNLIDRNTPNNLKVEAITALNVLTQDNNAGVRSAAVTAIAVLDSKLEPGIIIGPATVTPAKKSIFKSPKAISLAIIAGTAVLSTVALWAIFRHRTANGLGMGRLRKRVENLRLKKS